MVVDTAVIAREPVGVVVGIAPWNAPFGIMANKVFYALVAGCTIIMKPSPETPLEAYIIAEAAEAAGLPPGVVNLVPAEREASDHLVCNPRHRQGQLHRLDRRRHAHRQRLRRPRSPAARSSSAASRRRSCATTSRSRRPPGILGNTITVMSGQVCAMLSRAIVPRHRHDELAEAIAGRDEGHQDRPLARIPRPSSARWR